MTFKPVYSCFVPDLLLASMGGPERQRLMIATAEGLAFVSGARNVASGFVSSHYSITRSGWTFDVTFASNAWTGRRTRLALPSFRFGPVRFTGTLDAFTLVAGPVTLARLHDRWILSAGPFKLVGIGRRFVRL